MNPADLPSDDVVRELYPVTVRQARTQAVVEVAALTVYLVLLVITGFPKQLAFFGGMLLMGIAATAYDLRWWLWLRNADPRDAYVRAQARDDSYAGPRSPLFAVVIIILVAIWLRFGSGSVMGN